jgi:hypothetical protein
MTMHTAEETLDHNATPEARRDEDRPKPVDIQPEKSEFSGMEAEYLRIQAELDKMFNSKQDLHKMGGLSEKLTRLKSAIDKFAGFDELCVAYEDAATARVQAQRLAFAAYQLYVQAMGADDALEGQVIANHVAATMIATENRKTSSDFDVRLGNATTLVARKNEEIEAIAKVADYSPTYVERDRARLMYRTKRYQDEQIAKRQAEAAKNPEISTEGQG